MAKNSRGNSGRHEDARGDSGAASIQGWLGSRLELLVSASINEALRAALNPANRVGMPFLWWPEAAATSDSLAGEAGSAVAEVEDFSRRVEKHAGKIPGESKAAGDADRSKVRAELDKDLNDARAAKNKVAGAAAAAKKFGAARPGIVAAEASFDAAEDVLDDYDSSPVVGSNFAAKNAQLKDAATKIKDDVVHLKDALAAITA